MVLLLKVLLPSLLFIIHSVQSFCIYNFFEDGTTIEVVQKVKEVLYHQRFNKHIKPYDQACCHYSNTDCSPKHDLLERVEFEVVFRWSDRTSDKHLVSCIAGAAISFFGSKEGNRAICRKPFGSEERVPIILAPK